jgi:hypothetical protein
MAKIKLVENISLNVKKENIVASNESSKLIEAVDGKPYNCRGVLKSVKISRYTENLNGRVYPQELWSNVKKQNMAEGTLALADHPGDEEGSVTKICGVWKNLQLGEEFVTADCYLVGEIGQMILEAIQAGSNKIGLSSVGWGELSESDGKTVDPNSYTLERTADFVLAPSQNVFATYENIAESTQEIKKENIFENQITNKLNSNDNILTEQTITEKREINTMDKVQAANFKNQVRVALRESIRKTDLKEALEDLTVLRESAVLAEMPDQVEKIESTISDIQTKMEEQIKEATKTIETKEATVKELQEKVDTTTKVMEELKKENEKLKAIVEKSADSKQVKMLEEVKKDMEADIEAFSEDREIMEKDIKVLKEGWEGMEEDLSILKKERKDMQYDIKRFRELKESLTKDNSVLGKRLKEAEKYISKCEKILEDEYGYEFDDTEDPYIDPVNDEGEVQLGEPTGMIEEFGDDYLDTENDLDIVDDTMIADEDFIDYDSEDSFYEAEEDDEKEDEEEITEEEEDDSEEEDEKEKVEESRKRKLSTDLKNFYLEAVRKQPAVKDLKENILRAKSVYEASQLVFALKNKSSKKNDVMTLTESKSKRNEGWVDWK